MKFLNSQKNKTRFYFSWKNPSRRDLINDTQITTNIAISEADNDDQEIEHWRKIRGKWKTLKWKGAERAYYQCKEKQSGCLARLQKTCCANQQVLVQMIGTHNHAPPQKALLSDDAHVKGRKVATFPPPGQAHTHIIKDLATQGEQSSSSNTPTRTQLRNKRNYQCRKLFPSTNAFDNIWKMHGKEFLSEMNFHPSMYICLANKQRLFFAAGASTFNHVTLTRQQKVFKEIKATWTENKVGVGQLSTVFSPPVHFSKGLLDK